MVATFRKRGDAWRVEIFKQGVRRSGTFDTKAEGITWATRVENEILSGKLIVVKEAKTLADVLERYKNDVSPTKGGARWEIVRIEYFIRSMKIIGARIDKITPDDISKWRDERLKSVSRATVNREMNLLSAVFECARREWRYCSSNPVRDVTRPAATPSRDVQITDAVADKVLAFLSYTKGADPKEKRHMIALAFLFAMETAMRAGEITALTPEHVFLAKRYVKLPKTKNGDSRDVALSNAAAEILDIALKIGANPVFNLTADGLSSLFRKYRDIAAESDPELADVHFHDTRHEAITRLARKLDVLDLARMIGHRDIKSLMIYYNATATDIAGRLD